MTDLNATSSLYLNESLTADNEGRPVYAVCHPVTRNVVGLVALGRNDQWWIEGDDSNSWPQVTDAISVLMMGADHD